MKDQYVILTGSKNNAGDYLIKYRAKQLFSEFRSDRKIIDINGWEDLSNSNLNIINDSKALILMGGPALVEDMVPRVYSLANVLDKIKVPIIMMGIGWKSTEGNWKNTYHYKLNLNTLNLLKKVKNSGYLSSVRDYHTLSALRFNGCENILMTGCPAYYDQKYINTDIISKDINKVAFSLGVSFIESPSMLNLMKDNIIACQKKFLDKDFEVVFHHSLDRARFLNAYKSASNHVKMHNEFANWLESKNIKYKDISGSAENLMNYYSNIDLHIGYRVHAHIFMNSIAKKSVLISEDGRAKGVKGAISGIVLDGYLKFRNNFISKVLYRLLPSYDKFLANEFLTKELISEIDYEQMINFSRMKSSRKIIDTNFIIMKKFINQLP
jgi:hypothetical protein